MMKGPELRLWEGTVRNWLQTLKLDPVRVENGLGRGTPDVNYIHGWIELKDGGDWPKRPGTLLRLPHFLPQQSAWLARRWAAGGLSWVMIQVEREVYLFSGQDAPFVRAGITREVADCLAVWSNKKKDLTSLKAWLRGDGDEMVSMWDRCRLYRLLSRKTVEDVAADIGWVGDKVAAAEVGGEGYEDLHEHWVC